MGHSSGGASKKDDPRSYLITFGTAVLCIYEYRTYHQGAIHRFRSGRMIHVLRSRDIPQEFAIAIRQDIRNKLLEPVRRDGEPVVRLLSYLPFHGMPTF